jgi:hypothetical protein
MEVNMETLTQRFPKLMSRIDDEIDELRYLMVVDANEYDPEIDDEFDVFDPDDYNYMIYLTERLQNAMGRELLEQLPDLIEEAKLFENFLASEEDLYGAMSDRDEAGVALALLDLIESRLS